MYEQVYHFHSRPFTATPYVKHYFAGEAIQQSLKQASLCIDRGSGPVIVVGATGTGKSLLLAMLEEQYQSRFNVVNLGCARMDQRRELLQSVLYELQLPFKDLSEAELRFSLIDYLKPSESCPNGILLLVDEAHTLSTEMLDEIRLITNFVRDGQPRVRLVMAGSQRLEENLNDPKLDSFNQRIAARCYLLKMNRDETARYVTEHIDRAGGDGAQLFVRDSLRMIHDVTDGCPRLINQVCDHALILAATRAQTEITPECIQEAWADVQSIPGWGYPETATPTTSSDLKNEESWTVIEFGQLGEDSSSSESGTVFEFENASQAPNAIHPVDGPEAPVADVEHVAMEEHPDGNSGHETESDAAGKQVQPTNFPDPTEPVENFEDSPLSLEDQADAREELVSQSTSGSNPSMDAGELEARLSTVLYDDSENDDEHAVEFNSGNADIGDLELEQSQIMDQVESELADIFGRQETTAKPGSWVSRETENDDSEMIDRPIEGQFNQDADPEQGNVEIQADNQDRDDLVGEIVDPFDEAFAEEENLIDRYAPFVAHQNKSGLTLTSEDLAMLTPDSELQPTNMRSPAIFDTDSASTVADDQQPPSSVVDDEQPFASESNESMTGESEDVTFGETTSEEMSELHDEADDPLEQDIRSKAEEILTRLAKLKPVSCETSFDRTSNEDSQIHDAGTSADNPTVEKDEHSMPSARSPQVELVDSDYEKQNAALDESQQILNEILEQRHALARQREKLAADRSPQDAESAGETDEPVSDDQEMIIVNRKKKQSGSANFEVEDPIPFPSTPVSTGRAERMDYQKLFDQLREMTPPKE